MKTKLNRNQNRKRGFTLMELLVVVIILGVLAATIIPQFMTSTQDAKISTAKANVAQLVTTLERFHMNMDRFPTPEEGLKVLVDPPAGGDPKWRGPYITQLQNDPWGNPFQYRYPATQSKARFDVWSRGADNADGGEGEAADLGNW